MIRNCCDRVKNILLASEQYGIIVWKRIFACEILMVVGIYIAEGYVYIRRAFSPEPEVPESVVCVRWLWIIGIVAVLPIQQITMYRAIKQKSFRLFKIYYRIRKLSLFLGIPSVYYSRNYTTVVKTRALYPSEVGDIMIITTTALIYIWAQWVVYHHLTQFNVLATTKLEQYIETLRNETLNVSISPQLKDGELDDNFDVNNSVLQYANMGLDIVKKYILSPLDVQISHDEIIGQGEFAVIWKACVAQNTGKVDAVAKIAKYSESENLNLFLKEVQISIYVGENVNIVKFFGITSSVKYEDQFAIIIEHCIFGHLRNYLIKNHFYFENTIAAESISSTNNEHFENFQRAFYGTKALNRFVLEICSGMEYLAFKKVIHGDLSARNILLNSQLTIKISDFGISRRLCGYYEVYLKPSQKFKIPWKWASVEILEDFKFSEKSDVWAFGVTVFEIYNLCLIEPYENTVWTSEFPKLIRSGLQLEKPQYASEKIYDLMKLCWLISCSRRPNFTQLKKELLESYTT